MSNDGSTTIGLRLQRECQASPEDVFDAFVQPEKQRSWLSPLGPDAVETSVDLRVGGVWESRFRPVPETLVHDVQIFREIQRPRRLVTDLVSKAVIDGQPVPPVETRIALTFAPIHVGTMLTAEQTGFASTETRDFFAGVAWPAALDRIARLLAG